MMWLYREFTVNGLFGLLPCTFNKRTGTFGLGGKGGFQKSKIFFRCCLKKLDVP